MQKDFETWLAVMLKSLRGGSATSGGAHHTSSNNPMMGSSGGATMTAMNQS